MNKDRASSRTQWLPPLPVKWRTIEPRRIFSVRKQSELPTDVHLTPSQKYGVLPQDDYIRITGTQVVRNISGTRMQHVEPGDFISHLRTFQGGLELAREPGKVSPAYTVITPTRMVFPGFFRYVLKSQGYISQIASVTDQLRDGQSMHFPEFNETWLPLPPLASQHLIADYLDHETAEIDAMVADQTRMRTLSDERQASSVWHSVTGGTSTDGTPQATEWFGSLPPGWIAEKLSWLFSNIGSGTTPRTEDESSFDGDINWVTTSELREKPVESTTRKVSPSTIAAYPALKVFNPGTLMIAMYGATIGRMGWLEERATVNQAVCALSGYTAGPDRFPYYALLAARKHIVNLASGGGQPNVSQEKIRSLRIPVPPKSEQQAIVAQLDQEEAEFRSFRQDIDRAIALAKERRAALITAAVTGQIDVSAKNRPAAEQLEDDIKELP